MLDRLARRWIPHAQDTEDPAVRAAYGQLANGVAIACNGLLFGFKLLAGLLAGSVAIVADACNNLSDAASNVIALLGFRLAARPADDEHPYGHGRYEYVAGLVVSVLILLAGVELLRTGLDRVLHPALPDYSLLSLLALGASVGLKLWMMAFNRSTGRRIGSQTLAATAADSRNDAIASAVILLGAGLARATGLDLDGWLGTGVALFVLYSGVSLIREALDPLLGRKPAREQIAALRQAILQCPGVLDTHDLMLHDYGPGRQFASAHVEIAAEDDIRIRHRQLEALSRSLLEEYGIHMIFQLDPVSSDDTEEDRLRSFVLRRLSAISPDLAIHDPRISRVDGTLTVGFDCYLPAQVEISEKELRRMLDAAIWELYPGARTDVTVDRDFMAPPH